MDREAEYRKLVGELVNAAWNLLPEPAVDEAAAKLDALVLPALRDSQRLDWQPIETAPRDGTPVIVFMPEPMLGSHTHAATFHPKVAAIGGVFDFDAPSQPTHWLPLPAAPKIDAATGVEQQDKE